MERIELAPAAALFCSLGDPTRLAIVRRLVAGPAQRSRGEHATDLIAVQAERLTRRGLRLAQFTVACNVIEGVVAVTAGLMAGLVSVIGFASNRPSNPSQRC